MATPDEKIEELNRKIELLMSENKEIKTQQKNQSIETDEMLKQLRIKAKKQEEELWRLSRQAEKQKEEQDRQLSAAILDSTYYNKDGSDRMVGQITYREWDMSRPSGEY